MVIFQNYVSLPEGSVSENAMDGTDNGLILYSIKHIYNHVTLYRYVPPQKRKKTTTYDMKMPWGKLTMLYENQPYHIVSGWWLSHPSEKNMSQLGLFSTHGKTKVVFQTTIQLTHRYSLQFSMS